LGSLTGEANESGIGLSSESPSMDDSQEVDIDVEDSTAFETGEASLDEEEELDISMLDEDSGEISMEDEEDITFEDSSEIELTDEPGVGPEESVSDFDLEGDEEDVSLGLGDLSLDDTGTEKEPESEISLDEGEEEEIELGDFSLDEDGVEGEPETGVPLDEGEETEINLESIALETEGASKDEDEMELKLDDLKLNDTGELEIGTKGDDSGEAAESLDAGAISPDESEPEERRFEAGQGEDEGIEIDLEEISLDDLEGSETTPDSDEEEMSLDLEDLDLDIDLDEPKK
jgi:hypothetical protein